MKNRAYSRRTLLRWRWRKDHARFSTKAMVAATTVETIFDVSGLFVTCSTKLNRPMSTRKHSAPTVPNFASSWKAARTRASRDRSRLKGSETVVAIGSGYRRMGRSASRPNLEEDVLDTRLTEEQEQLRKTVESFAREV